MSLSTHWVDATARWIFFFPRDGFIINITHDNSVWKGHLYNLKFFCFGLTFAPGVFAKVLSLHLEKKSFDVYIALMLFVLWIRILILVTVQPKKRAEFLWTWFQNKIISHHSFIITWFFFCLIIVTEICTIFLTNEAIVKSISLMRK